MKLLYLADIKRKCSVPGDYNNRTNDPKSTLTLFFKFKIFHH